MSNRIDGNLHVAGHFTATTMAIANGTITNAMVNGSAAIDASKLVQRKVFVSQQLPGTDVVTRTEVLGTVRNAAEVQSIDVFLVTPPSGTGVNKQFTVDLQRSTAGGAFASILTSVVTIDNSDTARSVSAGVINDGTLVAGDTLQVVITASGSTGTQAQGMAVTVNLDENPS